MRINIRGKLTSDCNNWNVKHVTNHFRIMILTMECKVTESSICGSWWWKIKNLI